MTVQVGSLRYNTGKTRMGEFRDRLWGSCVNTKFGHLDNMFMWGMAKVLVDELKIEMTAHAHDTW